MGLDLPEGQPDCQGSHPQHGDPSMGCLTSVAVMAMAPVVTAGRQSRNISRTKRTNPSTLRTMRHGGRRFAGIPEAGDPSGVHGQSVAAADRGAFPRSSAPRESGGGHGRSAREIDGGHRGEDTADCRNSAAAGRHRLSDSVDEHSHQQGGRGVGRTRQRHQERRAGETPAMHGRRE